MEIFLAADSAGKPLLDVIEGHLNSKNKFVIKNLSKEGYYADIAADLCQVLKAKNSRGFYLWNRYRSMHSCQ